MLTNGLFVLSKLFKGRREFKKELGRGAECILKDVSEINLVASIEAIPSPIGHLLRHSPNYAEPPMLARSVN
jgi:hypothetical protein